MTAAKKVGARKAPAARRKTNRPPTTAAQPAAPARALPAAAGGQPRCAAGFTIWNAETGQCRRCIIAGRDTCAGED